MKRVVKVTAIACAILALSGCDFGGSTEKTRTTAPQIPVSGFFVSTDRGETWQERMSLLTSDGSRATFSGAEIRRFYVDPADSNTFYLATNQGIFYSHNRGQGWTQTLSHKGIINDIAIDPNDNCTLYALAHNEVHKSANCARSWRKIHFSTLTGDFYTAISVHYWNSNVVYLATNKGALERSLNKGASWDVIANYKQPVTRIIMDHRNRDTFYLIQKNDIQQTVNDGLTWNSILNLPVRDSDGTPIMKNQKPTQLASLPGATHIFDLQLDASQQRGLLYASSYGIFRQYDGEYWQEISILNQPRAQKIYSLDINANNGQDIYFAVQGALFRSVNGGRDWSLRDVPARGVPRFVALADDNENEIFIGFAAQ